MAGELELTVIAASVDAIAISGLDITGFSGYLQAIRMFVPNISWIPLNPPFT